MRAFTGKVAAITGAGSGMGAALARALAAQGCHLALADRNAEALAEVQAAVSAQRVKVTADAIDVSDPEAVNAWAAQTQRAHGAVHLLFNNAGVSVTGAAAAMKMADFEWLMNINFWGVVHGCRAFLPYLSAAPHAHIINTASIFGVVAVPSQSAYNASKFAVRGYTESLEQELRDTQVRVSCVLPGGVKTNIVRSSRYYPSDNAAPTRDEAIVRFEAMAGLTSDQAADIILAGVRRDKRRILVGNDARLLDWVARALPTRYPEVIRWLSERNGSREPLS
jgi:short-subunit dehydrogenase